MRRSVTVVAPQDFAVRIENVDRWSDIHSGFDFPGTGDSQCVHCLQAETVRGRPRDLVIVGKFPRNLFWLCRQTDKADATIFESVVQSRQTWRAFSTDCSPLRPDINNGHSGIASRKRMSR